MITEPVIIDTGPLVPLLQRQDSQHELCTKQAAEIAGRTFTSWAVLTEAAWLLRDIHNGLDRLLELVDSGQILCHHLESAASWLRRKAKVYHDLNPQIADLSLLWLAKQQGTRYVFTLDRRDFLVYRDEDGNPFQLLPPER